MASTEKKTDEEVKLQYGFFPEMKLNKHLILGISLLWAAFFLKKLLPPSVKPLPVCANAHSVEVTYGHPEGVQAISRACLSGVVMVPKRVQRSNFVVVAPGSVKLWFVLADGSLSRPYSAVDLHDHTGISFPSWTFRISGDPGIAKIRVQ
ncbi:hypothetical protein KGO95_04480 [Patescibacteria group bacterium]|nr:hypothetical protein [Patescibacteria group bacterium]